MSHGNFWQSAVWPSMVNWETENANRFEDTFQVAQKLQNVTTWICFSSDKPRRPVVGISVAFVITGHNIENYRKLLTEEKILKARETASDSGKHSTVLFQKFKYQKNGLVPILYPRLQESSQIQNKTFLKSYEGNLEWFNLSSWIRTGHEALFEQKLVIGLS